MSNLARDFMNSDAVVGVARGRRIGITNNNPRKYRFSLETFGKSPRIFNYRLPFAVVHCSIYGSHHAIKRIRGFYYRNLP